MKMINIIINDILFLLYMRDKIISYIDNTIYSMNKKKTLFYLNIFNYFHLFIDIFIISYLFIFPIYFDFYLSLIVFCQSLHWLFLKNECIISYIEKKLKNKNYKLGNSIYYIPHEERFFNNFFIVLKTIIFISIIIYLFYRNKGITKILFGITVVIIFYVLLCKHIDKKKHENCRCK